MNHTVECAGGHGQHIFNRAFAGVAGTGRSTPVEQGIWLAHGRDELFQMTEVRLRVNEQERATICVFGKPEIEPLLGAYALEGFGLAADPVNRRLIPAQLYLL